MLYSRHGSLRRFNLISKILKSVRTIKYNEKRRFSLRQNME